MASKMSVELVANDGSRDVLPLFPSTEQIQTVKIMLGPTVVEIKTTHGDDGSTSLDVPCRQHQDPKPIPLALGVDDGRLSEKEKRQKENNDWVKDMRGWLMVLASLFASMAFQAGLNPPEGVWQDDSPSNMLAAPSPAPSPINGAVNILEAEIDNYSGPTGHRAGDSILFDTNKWRFAFFMVFNSYAFGYSLCMVLMLLSESVFHWKYGVLVLRFLMFVDILCLVGAFATGCVRDPTRTSISIAAMLAGFLSIAVVYIIIAKKAGKRRSSSGVESTT